MNQDIELLRRNIDTIEDKLILLLNERAMYALDIGKIKKEQGLPIVDSKREEDILNRVTQKNKGPVSNEFIRDIFKKIIEESVSLELRVSN